MFSRVVLLRLAASPGFERLVRRSQFSQGLIRRFVAGETLEETEAQVRALNTRGVCATLDHLGENVATREAAGESAARCREVLTFISERRLNANLSLKLTQLGLDLGIDIAAANLETVLAHAADLGIFVRIDMEGSLHTETTLSLYYRLLGSYPNSGIVIQSYLYRTANDLERIISAGGRVRLVKGAYHEPADVAFQSNAHVERSFRELTDGLMERSPHPAIATHDPALLAYAQESARRHSVGPRSFEMQLLYGVRRDLQDRLAEAGYLVRVYVPFGTQWYGYTMRRLAERPANLLFVLRHMIRR